MADIFSKEKRSEVMSRISGKNTKPELAVRSLLHQMGYRFRLHNKKLPAKPDIVLAKYRTVIFVHGCYWHRHKDCRRGKSTPSTNKKFWNDKFKRTVERDRQAEKALKTEGWQVIVIWACELKNLDKLTFKLQKKLANPNKVS